MNKEAMKQPECKTCGDKKEVEYEPDDIQGDVMIPCPDCQQPLAGEWTKKLRDFIKLYENEVPRRAEITFLEEACKIIDQAKADKDDLLKAIKKAHKEGYEDGYADGVATDGCVENNEIDQDDWAKAWSQSEVKTAIAKE